jgi:hypothetical protein
MIKGSWVRVPLQNPICQHPGLTPQSLAQWAAMSTTTPKCHKYQKFPEDKVKMVKDKINIFYTFYTSTNINNIQFQFTEVIL